MAKGRKKIKRLPVLDSYIHRRWKNINSEQGLRSLTAFARAQKSGYNLRDLERSLSKIEAFSIHRPVRRNYPTPAIMVNEIGTSICFDLIQLTSLKKYNSNYAWILLCKDQFTKFISLWKLKTKKATEVAEAMKKALKEISHNGKYKIRTASSDDGVEFKGAVRDLLKKHNIKHYVNRGRNHAAMCENSVRRVKTVLFRWLSLNQTRRWENILPRIANKINHEVNMAHGFRPVEITEKNSDQVFQQLYHRLVAKPKKEAKFRVNDTVRVSGARHLFGKSYYPGYSKKVYRIKALRSSLPVDSYILEDPVTGQQLDTTFVESELSLALDNLKINDGSSRGSTSQ